MTIDNKVNPIETPTKEFYSNLGGWNASFFYKATCLLKGQQKAPPYTLNRKIEPPEPTKAIKSFYM